MGSLVSGGQSQGPFHSCLPSLNSKTGTLREGFGPSSTGVRREAPCGVSEFGDSCTGKRLQRLFAQGPEKIILPLFNFSTCRRWRPQSSSRCEVPGATGHRQPGWNIGFMAILIRAPWWKPWRAFGNGGLSTVNRHFCHFSISNWEQMETVASSKHINQ